MNEIFNFKDTFIIAQENWWLVLLAFALGIWIGWRTCSNSRIEAR
jgi:hypothetical protein